VSAGASTEELFEDAPCGYVTSDANGVITRVNRTFETLVGHSRDALVGLPFQRLLSIGARIFYETHYAPLLQMQGAVREIAVELVRADGTTVPALLNATLQRDASGAAQTIRTAVFEATERRSYEHALLEARDREHEVAAALQRGLLGGELPTDPALELAVSYRPAVEGLDVGGDWYDAFLLEDHRLAIAVGDVVGRGIGAGTAMGQLRSAARAVAATGRGPGAVLEALDAYARRHDVGQMTTLVYAEVDLRTGTMVMASAGHPPLAVAAPGAPAAFVWEGRSAPLDAEHRPRPRDETTLALAPGSVLLLYTDGLVERPDRSIQDGLDDVLRELERTRERTPVELIAAVEHALLDADRPADDVCVLALRWAPDPG
jgi:phosphoserine phosphatase RsbU/P